MYEMQHRAQRAGTEKALRQLHLSSVGIPPNPEGSGVYPKGSVVNDIGTEQKAD
jgi:hypothetical protein